jgi:hypothetical protein
MLGVSEMESSDHFLNTVKNRGFFVKLSADKLFQKAKIFDYELLCSKIEALMASFVLQETQPLFATFIINTLL